MNPVVDCKVIWDEPETVPVGNELAKSTLPLEMVSVVTIFSFVMVLTILPLPSTNLIEPVER